MENNELIGKYAIVNDEIYMIIAIDDYGTATLDSVKEIQCPHCQHGVGVYKRINKIIGDYTPLYEKNNKTN